jgi:hypothetical protein
MPRKNSKKSVKKNSVKKNSKTLEFNVNLENNPNAIVDPVLNSVNDEEKLGKLLNGMTQNSFNDGVDTTIHNTAMLLNTQLDNVLGKNPGLFDKKNLEKMLNYVIEPTLNQLNDMANNTNYNYNQFGGVVGEKQYNRNLKRGEQKGGFYPYDRVRTPFLMPRIRQPIVPRVNYNPRLLMPRTTYNPRLLMPRTMIVPSYTIVTHDRVKDLMDRRSRDKLNTHVSHHHSFEDNDIANNKKISIRDHPDVSDEKEITRLVRLGDNFYEIDVDGKTNVIVYGLNLYYEANANKSYGQVVGYAGYKSLLNKIEVRALEKSKNKSENLKYISNNKIRITPDERKRCGGTTDQSLNDFCNPIPSVKHGYFKGAGNRTNQWDRHVMMLENVIQ